MAQPVKVSCPVCGHYMGEFSSSAHYPGQLCRACGKRIVIENGRAVGWR